MTKVETPVPTPKIKTGISRGWAQLPASDSVSSPELLWNRPLSRQIWAMGAKIVSRIHDNTVSLPLVPKVLNVPNKGRGIILKKKVPQNA